MHSGKDNAVTMLKIPQTVMCKCGLTLLCYLGYLGAAKWLTQPNKPRCQPTPLTTSIHRGLSSFPFLPPSFFLSSPSRIYEPKPSTFHCITSHRDIKQNIQLTPILQLLSYRSPWRNTPLLSLCLTVAELLVS